MKEEKKTGEEERRIKRVDRVTIRVEEGNGRYIEGQ